jgi:hypothetical protein
VGNLFSNVTRGLRLDLGDRGLVEKNRFEDAGTAASIFNAGGWAFHNNSIVRSATGLVAEAGLPGNATRNWWGDATGPSGVGAGSGAALESTGFVPYDPWLVEEPKLKTKCPKLKPVRH